jgi:hypothetical protein
MSAISLAAASIVGAPITPAYAQPKGGHVSAAEYNRNLDLARSVSAKLTSDKAANAQMHSAIAANDRKGVADILSRFGVHMSSGKAPTIEAWKPGAGPGPVQKPNLFRCLGYMYTVTIVYDWYGGIDWKVSEFCTKLGEI